MQFYNSEDLWVDYSMAGPQHVKRWFGRSAGAKDIDLVFERLTRMQIAEDNSNVSRNNSKRLFRKRRNRRRRRRIFRDKAIYPVPAFEGELPESESIDTIN